MGDSLTITSIFLLGWKNLILYEWSKILFLEFLGFNKYKENFLEKQKFRIFKIFRDFSDFSADFDGFF